MRIDTPVSVTGRLEPGLSRWLWLVKWLLLIPHAIVLLFLWIAAAALSVVAWFAIVFTGRYPRPIFEFVVGVLRWTWRVAFYSYGGLGTDRYPPFTLADVPDYPARLEIPYPERLSRGQALVKSWLLAIPHYLVIGFFLGAGGYVANDSANGSGGSTWPWNVGLIGLLVLFAGVVLLVGRGYPRPIFDLVMGMDRWTLRVAAYALLMTDDYPPFRLDMGGDEPPRPVATTAPVSGQATAPEPVHEPGRWTPLRIVAAAAGSLALALSLGLGVAGGALAFADNRLRDDDGFLMTDGEPLTTASHAIVSDDVRLESERAVDAAFGDLQLRIDDADQPVFAGIAPTADVDAYLTGVAHSVFVNVVDGTPRYQDVAGGAPTTAPGDLPIWDARLDGDTLRWDVRDGDWTVVLMNADGSAGVSADVSVGATLPVLGWGTVTLFVAAALLFAIGLLAVLLALPRHRQVERAPLTGAPRGSGR